MHVQRIAVTALATIALAIGAVAAGAQVARVAGNGPRVSGCKTWTVPNSGGLVKMEIPKFCKNGQCEISVKWDGDYAGAMNPGLTWQVNYNQWDDGYWNAGPAMSFAGITTSDGSGRNGDSSERAILGPYGDGNSYFTILDDLPGFETSKSFFTLELHNESPSSPAYHGVIAFVCKR